MKNLIFIFAFVVVSQSIKFRKHQLSEVQGGSEQWFDQLLDHSVPTLTTTWRQRVIVYDQYYNSDSGVAILYICGEWTCNGAAALAISLAQQYNGIVFALEHRFYGYSQPMGFGEQSQTTESFEKYLNVHQALDDLAYFITSTTTNGLFGVTVNTPWFSMGGSYPGALAGWFRYKYPHLTIGSLASSGVVQAINNYYQYDYQVRLSTSKSGDDCPATIQAYTKLAESYVFNPILRNNFLKSFGAYGLTNGDFFDYLADVPSSYVQTGQRSKFCQLLKGLSDVQALELVKQLALDILDVTDYYIDQMKDTKFNPQSTSRQWMFQTCSQLSYWPAATTDGKALRSSILTVDYYRKKCRDVFGKSIDGQYIYADVESTNNYFGGNQINVKNLIMTNGGEDPWQWASINKNKVTSPDVEVILIDCEDCSHCVDLQASRSTDPQVLTDARITIQQKLGQWINAHWIKINKKKLSKQIML